MCVARYNSYVDRLFTWIEDQLNDERIFPTTLEAHFPANFKQRVSRVRKRKNKKLKLMRACVPCAN